MTQVVQRPQGARRRDAGRAGGHGVLPARPQRHRQERHAQAHHRPAETGRGPRRSCTARTCRALDAPRAGRASARAMGFLFQNAALFDSITVGENVAFPLRRHTDWPDAKIREVAKAQAGRRRPREGLRQDAGDLSGGMKKRAGLARAMALDPGHPAGRRAERGARSDHRRRDRRAAGGAEEEGDDARRGHAQHSERASRRRRAGDAARGDA